MLLVFLLSFAFQDHSRDLIIPDMKIERSGLFQPMDLDELVVRPDGHCYINNFNEAKILRFDSKGQLVGRVGKKGQGPGEFIYPSQIFFFGTHFYVTDLQNSTVSVFDKNDQFIKQIRMPGRWLSIKPAGDGWVYGNWGQIMDSKAPASIFVADSNFKNQSVLTKVAAGTSGGVAVTQEDGHIYQLIKNRPALLFSPDGKIIYIQDPAAFRFMIYDVASQKIIGEIKKNSSRVSFDTDWGKFKVAEMKAKRSRMGIHEGLVYEFPEYFPIIRETRIDPDGNLLVNRWMSDPEQNNSIVILDPHGNNVESKYDWETLGRIAAVMNDNAYITTFDPDTDEAGVARVKLGEANQFVSQNPINFDGGKSRTMTQ